jgi:hypothetical protein
MAVFDACVGPFLVIVAVSLVFGAPVLLAGGAAVATFFTSSTTATV